MAQSSWGSLIAWYLFLAGTGAGVYLIGTLMSLLNKKENNSIERIGAFWGWPLVGIGCGFLLMDLGRPTRFLYAMLRPFNSMISVGFIILCVFMVIGFYHMLLLKQEKPVSRWLKILGSFFAFGTAIYTGLLLGVVKAIPFWNSTILPVLFVLSALSAGAGLCLVVLVFSRNNLAGHSLKAVANMDLTILVVEAIALFSLLFISLQSGNATAEGAKVLIGGNFALVFWLFVVIVGIFAPLLLEITLEKKYDNPTFTLVDHLAKSETASALEQSSSKIYALIGLCLLVGSIALRYSILAAGIKVPLGL